MKKILEAILSLIGKKNYKVSQDLSLIDIISIFFYRFFDSLRGLFLKLRLGKAKLPVFRGSGGRILFPRRIYAKRSLNIGNNVYINALSNSTINMNKGIICSGYFNPIHIGHLELLENAKKAGDLLIVIVNSDLQRCFNILSVSICVASSSIETYAIST